jgi:hypothetical protein
MTDDSRTNDTTKDEELQNLPERPVTDADRVKGGAAAPPSGPVPIPYPNVKPGTSRSVDPCW